MWRMAMKKNPPRPPQALATPANGDAGGAERGNKAVTSGSTSGQPKNAGNAAKNYTREAEAAETHNCDHNSLPPEAADAETNYRNNDLSLKCLVAMSIGLKNHDGTPLFDEETLPWRKLRITDWRSTTKQLNKEIIRRHSTYNFAALANITPAPRPAAWPKDKVIKWLEDHPISFKDNGSTSAAMDVVFVMEEMARHKERVISEWKIIEKEEKRWSASKNNDSDDDNKEEQDLSIVKAAANKQPQHDFSAFSDSIYKLGNDNLAVARIVAQQKHKDRIHEAEEKKLDRLHQASEKERDRIHDLKRKYLSDIADLKREKRQLTVQLAQLNVVKRQKCNGENDNEEIETVKQIVDEVDKEIHENNALLEGLEVQLADLGQTPPKRHVTL